MTPDTAHELNPELRARIAAEAVTIFHAHYAHTDHALAVGGGCLYWALSAIRAAQRYGIRLVLQAGSAAFRRLPEALDDGKPDTFTHFSYVWSIENVTWTPGDDRDPDHANHPRPILPIRPSPIDGIPRMCLPEMHVWAGDPERQHLVDLSTFALPEQCQALLGQPWLEKKPPDFLWCSTKDLPDSWQYVPDRYATALAARLAALYRPDVPKEPTP